MEPTLWVTDLSMGYRGVTAVSGVSLTVSREACTAVVGANGAGKTSLLRAISGLEPTRQGSVRLEETDLGRLAPSSRVRRGLGHVLQDRHVFPGLTVRENLLLGAVARRGDRQGDFGFDDAVTLFPELAQMFDSPAGLLSGGQQQFLAIARALMGNPTVLLLDEPTLGLAPLLVMRIEEALQKLKTQGIALLLVEQRLSLVSAVADNVLVLSHGRTTTWLDGDLSGLEAAAHEAYLS